MTFTNFALVHGEGAGFPFGLRVPPSPVAGSANRARGGGSRSPTDGSRRPGAPSQTH
jgi:hypothetical protein